MVSARASRSIGIFDSGIGGLTVARAVREVLPEESITYLGDTGRTPYGTKSPDVVCRYSEENAGFLVDKGIKLLVVACNTASAVALPTLRDAFDVPVIGVIEPGAAAAVASTGNGKVGIVGTEATIRSGSYTRALRALARRSRDLYSRLPSVRFRWPRRGGSPTKWRGIPRGSISPVCAIAVSTP